MESGSDGENPVRSALQGKTSQTQQVGFERRSEKTLAHKEEPKSLGTMELGTTRRLKSKCIFIKIHSYPT